MSTQPAPATAVDQQRLVRPRLKPCPYCRGLGEDIMTPPAENADVFRCEKCGAETEGHEPGTGEHVKAWNAGRVLRNNEGERQRSGAPRAGGRSMTRKLPAPVVSPASPCSPRWFRAVVTLISFGRVWTTIFCSQWDSKKYTRILTRKVPRWVTRKRGSLIVAMATIDEPRLKIRAFEPGTQKTAAQVANDKAHL